MVATFTLYYANPIVLSDVESLRTRRQLSRLSPSLEEGRARGLGCLSRGMFSVPTLPPLSPSKRMSTEV